MPIEIIGPNTLMCIRVENGARISNNENNRDDRMANKMKCYPFTAATATKCENRAHV